MATTARSRKRAGAAAERLINRELSFLDYDARLLDLARDDTLPLLERVFFLKVSAEMLDEFFMVRVAGLTGQTEAGVSRRLPDGRTPQQTLDEARERVLEIYGSQAELWRNDALSGAGRGADRRLERRGARAGRARRARRSFRARDLPGADAARGRARPAVPLHLRAVDQSRPVRGRPRDRRGALREGQGPGRPAALLPHRPERPLRSARASPLPLPARALPGDGDPRAGAVPRDARRRSRGGRRGGRPARGRRVPAPPRALRRGDAARGVAVDVRGDARAAAAGAERP